MFVAQRCCHRTNSIRSKRLAHNWLRSGDSFEGSACRTPWRSQRYRNWAMRLRWPDTGIRGGTRSHGCRRAPEPHHLGDQQRDEPCLSRWCGGPSGAARDMALDIVSYGRRGPGGTLRFGADQIAQIQRTVGRTSEVMVKISGGGRDVGGVNAHLRYIGRHGKLPMETDAGLTLQGRGALPGRSRTTGNWTFAGVSTSPG